MTDSDISDMTVLILRGIREDLRGLKNEVRGTNQRLDTLTGEVHVTNERLSVVEHTVRDAADQIRAVGRNVKNKHEKEIESLRQRVTRLEAKTSGGGP